MPVKEAINVRRSSPIGVMTGVSHDAPSLAVTPKTPALAHGTDQPVSIAKPAGTDVRVAFPRFPCIIGQDPKMKAVFKHILDVAPYDYPVCLSGATGTGKELVARAIHDHSPRRHAAFVAVNCGALPENLVESELFGHVKGAFSGAGRSRKGRFELAHRGTLFLDEVADLSPYIQIRLLRVLQCKKFEKVGGERTISVDVRVISATNKPLKTEMNAGRFRQDLYYRLNVVPIHLPPLNARRMDIPLLAQHFLNLAATRYKREPMSFTDRALSAIVNHDWPGNVRELQNAVHLSFVRSHGSVIDARHLPSEIHETTFSEKYCRLDADRVVKALDHCGGNKSRAARYLGVGRATLYRFLSSAPEFQSGP